MELSCVNSDVVLASRAATAYPNHVSVEMTAVVAQQDSGGSLGQIVCLYHYVPLLRSGACWLASGRLAEFCQPDLGHAVTGGVHRPD